MQYQIIAIAMQVSYTILGVIVVTVTLCLQVENVSVVAKWKNGKDW